MVKNNGLKFGFTLAEIMVCLVVISVLATILIPTLHNFKPNRNKIMFKKTYTNVERGIYELVHNETLYPQDENYEGLDNFTDAVYMGVHYSGNAKFCRLLAMLLNTETNDTDTRCNSSHTFANSNDYSFITTDGVAWGLPAGIFRDKNVWYDIRVDVNGLSGDNSGPDRLDGNGTCNEKTTDRFIIKARADGKIKLVGSCAKKFASEMNLLKENE